MISNVGVYQVTPESSVRSILTNVKANLAPIMGRVMILSTTTLVRVSMVLRVITVKTMSMSVYSHRVPIMLLVKTFSVDSIASVSLDTWEPCVT